jgi:hypothetical protein
MWPLKRSGSLKSVYNAKKPPADVPNSVLFTLSVRYVESIFLFISSFITFRNLSAPPASGNSSVQVGKKSLILLIKKLSGQAMPTKIISGVRLS